MRTRKKTRPVKVMDRHIYHLPRGHGYPGIEGHDVVVVRHFKKTKWSKVRSITSLEKKSRKSKKMEWVDSALRRAKDGKIVPVPLSEVKTRHWSGIDNRERFVKDSDLERRAFAKKARIKDKYLK